MNNVYSLLKLNRYIRSPRLKSLGIFFLHIFGKRYLGIFYDPVLACNLRCRMCYFSDPEKSKTMKGISKKEDLELLADAFFNRALKLQIGCGAEPSLFPYNRELIRLGKIKQIPYISMTTNANKYNKEDWQALVDEGLDEVTLSLHGVLKETYENLMAGASYEKFLQAMQDLTEIKKNHPAFKVRLNYTVNEDNLDELSSFYDIFSSYTFDVLQIRPINQIGETDYHNFSWKGIYECYDEIIQKLKDISKDKGIVCIAPEKKDFVEEKENTNKLVEESTYCYISPHYVWRNDFDLKTDTYDSYARRTKLSWKLFHNIFLNSKAYRAGKEKLNYDVN